MRFALVSFIMAATAVLAMAQWLGYRVPGTPVTRDGKVNLNAPTPKARDGKPDLSGVWHPEITPVSEWRRELGDDVVEGRMAVMGYGMGIGTISIYSYNVLRELKPGDNPLRPDAKPPAPPQLCLPVPMPSAVLLTPVHKFIQTPGITLMMLEASNFTRQIYTDGRPLPKDPQPSWYGYSVGKWQGDTFVVETIGFNDKAPLDTMRHPRSENMRMTERYRRRDYGHMDVEITFDDPTNYTHPFSIHFVNLLEPDSDMLENVCEENEKDAVHLRAK